MNPRESFLRNAVKKMFLNESHSIKKSDLSFYTAESYIEDTDKYLKTACMECGINYYSETIEFPVYRLNDYNLNVEGFFSTIWNGIKTIAKKMFKFIVWIWKGLVGFVKKVIAKIKSFFTGKNATNLNAETEKPIEVEVIALESASIKKTKINSKKELEAFMVKHIEKISKEINHRSKDQIEAAKELEKWTERYKPAQEAKIVRGKEINRYIGAEYLDQQGKLDPNKPSGIADEYMWDKSRPDFDPNQKADLLYGDHMSYSQASGNSGSIDASKYKEALNAENVVEAYNNLINFSIDNNRLLKGIVDELERYGVTQEEARKYVTSNFFITSDNPDVVRNLINLRLNYNKSLVSILKKMITIDFQFFNIDASQVDAFISGEKDITSLMREANKDWKKYMKRKDFYDFRPLGAGVVFLPINSNEFNEKLIKELFNFSLKWDCVIIAHGGLKTTNVSDEIEKYVDDEDYATYKKFYDKAKKDFDDVKAKLIRLVEEHLKNSFGGDEYENLKDDINYFERYCKKLKKELLEELTWNIPEDDKYLGMFGSREEAANNYFREFWFDDKLKELAEKFNLDKTNVKMYERKMRDLEWSQEKLDKINEDMEKEDFHKKAVSLIEECKSKDELKSKLGDNYYRVHDISDAMFMYYNSKDKIEKYSEKMKNLSDDGSDIRRQNFGKYQGDMKEKLKDCQNGKDWYIEPVQILDFPPTFFANDVVRNAIKAGFKRIMLYCCNPQHFKLAPDILRAPGVTINQGFNVRLTYM